MKRRSFLQAIAAVLAASTVPKIAAGSSPLPVSDLLDGMYAQALEDIMLAEDAMWIDGVRVVSGAFVKVNLQFDYGLYGQQPTVNGIYTVKAVNTDANFKETSDGGDT